MPISEDFRRGLPVNLEDQVISAANKSNIESDEVRETTVVHI